jgi:predicted transcriptional regulator
MELTFLPRMIRCGLLYVTGAGVALRRSREDILYRILKSCASDQLSVYQLMVSLNLSYKSLKSCLDQLARSRLVTINVEARRRTVSTTQEGLRVVSLYHDAMSSLKSSLEIE